MQVSAVRQLRRSPPAATAGLWHVAAGDDSAVLKLVALRAGGSPQWPATEAPDDPHYWRREPLAYSSGLLARAGAPRCRAVVERADGSVALWLDDARGEPAWSPQAMAAVARRWALVQAEFAERPAREPWLVRGFLRRYAALHEVPDADAERVLARLDELPATLAHNDFHPANVIGDDGTVVIDWAYVGLAPFGLDVGVLVADGVADGAIAPELAGAAGDAVWSAYVAGLREAGGRGDERQVRWAYLRGTALRLSWLEPALERLTEDDPRRPAWRATVELLDRWRAESETLLSGS